MEMNAYAIIGELYVENLALRAQVARLEDALKARLDADQETPTDEVSTDG